MRIGKTSAIAVAVLILTAVGACGDDAEFVEDSSTTGPMTPLTPVPGATFTPYEGLLGDFLITPGEVGELVCDEATVTQLESELSAAFPDLEIFVTSCAVHVGLDAGSGLSRLAFAGEPHIPFEAPKDDLELVTIGGRPGLIAHPPIPQIPPRVAILERAPDEEPGILIEILVDPLPGSLEAALAHVERFLETKPQGP